MRFRWVVRIGLMVLLVLPMAVTADAENHQALMCDQLDNGGGGVAWPQPVFLLPSPSTSFDAQGRAIYVGTDEAETVVVDPDWTAGTVVELKGGHDTFCGGPGPDVVYGGRGRDSLSGLEGDDKLRGGSQADDIWGGPGDDAIWGKGGPDDIWGGTGNDRIRGNPGDDDIEGGGGRDTIKGHGGDDTIDGGPGPDVLKGGKGDDTLIGDTKDTIDGGPGNDTCGSASQRGSVVDCEGGSLAGAGGEFSTSAAAEFSEKVDASGGGFSFSVLAGGPVDATYLGGSCAGYGPTAPPLRIQVEESYANRPLTILASLGWSDARAADSRAPTMTLTPNSGPPGTEVEINVTGSSWGNAMVTVEIEQGGVTDTIVNAGETDANGDLKEPIKQTIHGDPGDTVTITVVINPGSSEERVSKVFTITEVKLGVVAYAPDGTWHCAGLAATPTLQVAQAMPGDWRVWVTSEVNLSSTAAAELSFFAVEIHF